MWLFLSNWQISHATSFLKDEINASHRVLGMKITFWSIIVMAILNILPLSFASFSKYKI